MWETLESITNVNKVNVSQSERWISLVGGSVLLVYALIRIPMVAVVALFGAVYLLFRSIRGFCYLYERLGKNTAVQLPADESYPNRGTAVFPPPPRAAQAPAPIEIS